MARELLKMAASHGLNVAAVLALGEQCMAADDVSGLMNQLNDYVGENGRLTALVKATAIALPLAELQGYDVVDTPGMNDPVPSRTQKTREYMAECAVRSMAPVMDSKISVNASSEATPGFCGHRADSTERADCSQAPCKAESNSASASVGVAVCIKHLIA